MSFNIEKGYVPIPDNKNSKRRTSANQGPDTNRFKDMGKKIFISHSGKDKDIAEAFVDLILHGGLSVPINEIFCTSTEGTKIKSGDDWRKSIKNNIGSAKINFLIISPNYKESEVCLNEMGAAWMTDSIVLPLIVPPINLKTVGVIQEPNQIEKLLDESSLDRIKDIVQAQIDIDNSLIKSDRWTSKKKEFIIRINSHLRTNPFEIPMDRDSFETLNKEKVDLEKTIEIIVEEKLELANLVEQLKLAKDKNEVSAIIGKRKKSTKFDEFQTLCNNVKDLLSNQDSIINGVIFKSYSGKEVKIGWEGNRDELDEALANDYIDEDLDIKWDATKEMRKIYKALQNVSSFINSDLDEGFDKQYEENYGCPFDISNKKFWEDAFEADIRFK